MVYLQIGISMQELKKKEFSPFTTAWMELKTLNAKLNQPIREDEYYDLTYMCNLMNKIN